MRFPFAVLNFFLLLGIGLASENSTEEPTQSIDGYKQVKTKWIKQRLDHNHHHHHSHHIKWDQRILINDEYYVEGRPLFIMIGGEWRLNATDIIQGLWHDIAKDHNGTLVYTEHRFYGESLPTKEFTVENLQYLSMNQALADLAHVIDTLKSEEKYKNSKVVLAGCSYAGTMTVHFRKLYPNHSVGGWATSAPLEPVLDFKEYLETVGLDLKKLGGQKCYDRIKNATAYFEDRAYEIKNHFNICSTFNASSELDQWALFYAISDYVSIIAHFEPQKIPAFCKDLLDLDSDDAIAYAKWVHQNFTKDECINGSYQDIVDEFKRLMLHPDGELKLPWFYQVCNEFGYIQSSTSPNQPFGSKIPVQYILNLCQDVFGDNFNAENVERNVARTKAEIGGKNAAIENTYQTHGELDPWHVVGAGINEGAIIIPNEGHCCDLNSFNNTDSRELKKSKRHLIRLVRKWVSN